MFEDPDDDGKSSDWSPQEETRGKKERKEEVISTSPAGASSSSKENNVRVPSSSSKENNVQVPTMNSPHAPSESLESLKVSELREKLQQYGLKLSGKKAVLQARLEEYMSLHYHHQEPPTITQEQEKGPDERKPSKSIENFHTTTSSKTSFTKDNTSFSGKQRNMISSTSNNTVVSKRTCRQKMNRDSALTDNSTMDERSAVFVYTTETTTDDILKAVFTHLLVDSSVTEIHAKAFWHCKALTHVQLPETLTRIRFSAFEGCLNLKQVQFVANDNSPGDISSMNNRNLEDGLVVIPEKVKLQIDPGAFRDLKNVTYVKLPKGIKEIAPSLFSGCISLSTVKIPETVTVFGDCAFSRCTKLTFSDLPPRLETIGSSCFEGCCSIENLRIPSTVSSIQKYAFRGCSRLKSIELPPALKEIKARTFMGCDSLEYIEIPSTVFNIWRNAFPSTTKCIRH
eukprot:scaffold965_cov93-Cylindrotheca_fusiformis.AAC.11